LSLRRRTVFVSNKRMRYNLLTSTVFNVASMDNKSKSSPLNIALVAVMCVAIGLLIVTHVDPVQTLIGMLLGVFVLVVVVDGGRQRALGKKLGPAIQQEIDDGRVYSADVPPSVLSLLKEGKKVQAIKLLTSGSGIGLFEAKNRLDEIHLRLTMGQSIKSRFERE